MLHGEAAVQRSGACLCAFRHLRAGRKRVGNAISSTDHLSCGVTSTTEACRAQQRAIRMLCRYIMHAILSLSVSEQKQLGMLASTMLLVNGAQRQPR